MKVLAWQTDEYLNKLELIGLFSNLSIAMNKVCYEHRNADEFIQTIIDEEGHLLFESIEENEVGSDGVIAYNNGNTHTSTDYDNFKQLCFQVNAQNILTQCIKIFENLPKDHQGYIELNVPIDVTFNFDCNYRKGKEVYLKSISYINNRLYPIPESYEDFQNWQFEVSHFKNNDDMVGESKYYEFAEFVESFHDKYNFIKIVEALKEIPLYSIFNGGEEIETGKNSHTIAQAVEQWKEFQYEEMEDENIEILKNMDVNDTMLHMETMDFVIEKT
jgi:hypothetical protein